MDKRKSESHPSPEMQGSERPFGGPLGYAEICQLLPHRPPFLLVDKVVDYAVGEWLHAIKCVSALEPFFPGHFPGNPIYPGVLLVEGMAQAGAILLLETFRAQGPAVENKCILTSIDEVRFRRQVVPGDVLHYHTRYGRRRGTFVWFSGEVRIGDEVVAEAKLSAAFTKSEGN